MSLPEKIDLDPFPHPGEWKRWKKDNAIRIAHYAKGRVEECLVWIFETEDEKKDISFFAEKGAFPEIDDLMGPALVKIIPKNHRIIHKVRFVQEQYWNFGYLIRGRQLWKLFELNFHANAFQTQMNEWELFKALRMENNDLRKFFNGWNTFIATSFPLPTFRKKKASFVHALGKWSGG